MKNKLFGAVATFLGMMIVLRYFLTPQSPLASGSYKTGQLIAMIVGLLILAIGLHWLFKAPNSE